MEAETGMRQPQAGGHQSLQAATRSWKNYETDRFSFRGSRRNQPLPHLHLRFLASGTVREQIPDVLSHPVCRDSFQQPRKSSPPPFCCFLLLPFSFPFLLVGAEGSGGHGAGELRVGQRCRGEASEPGLSPESVQRSRAAIEVLA